LGFIPYSVNLPHIKLDSQLPISLLKSNTYEETLKCKTAAANASTIMTTHLVAFLLLKKYRSGTTLDVLVQETKDLQKFLEKRHRGFGFTGDLEAAVLHGVRVIFNN
jgi:hypothetical protein